MDSDVLYSTIDIRDSGSGIQHLGGQRGRELGVTSLSSFSFAFFFFEGGRGKLVCLCCRCSFVLLCSMDTATVSLVGSVFPVPVLI